MVDEPTMGRTLPTAAAGEEEGHQLTPNVPNHQTESYTIEDIDT